MTNQTERASQNQFIIAGVITKKYSKHKKNTVVIRTYHCTYDSIINTISTYLKGLPICIRYSAFQFTCPITKMQVQN